MTPEELRSLVRLEQLIEDEQRRTVERLEAELKQALSMFAALVYSMPDHRATLWPPDLERFALTLHRFDSPTNGSVTYRAEGALRPERTE